MAIHAQEKIITLWAVFLLGTLFHTQLGLMPLFHGQSVALDSHGSGDIGWIFWLMLAFFVVPMLGMIIPLFNNSYRYRTIHFGVTLLYSVLNLMHVVADLMVRPIFWYQIALMVLLFFIGLLLNRVAFQWMQDRPHAKRWNRLRENHL